MTDTEIIETLYAREHPDSRWVIMKRGYYYRPDACGYTSNIREAWVVSEKEARKHEYPHDEPVTIHRLPASPYLTSHDALRPVLATFSRRDKILLAQRLATEISDDSPARIMFGYECVIHALTIDPRVLATKMAEVIKEGEKK